MSAPTFRRLVATDEAVVRGWIEAYLVEHVGWWLAARGLDRDPAAVVRERGLVERDWHELTEPDDRRRVEIAELDGVPVGIVRAALREDRHMGVLGGVLEWLAVAPTARGRGIAGQLVHRATAWFDANGADGAEVFVTATNGAAVRAYQAAGFVTVDARMIRPRAPDR